MKIGDRLESGMKLKFHLIDIHEDSEKRGDKKANSQQLGKERKK